MAVIGRYFPERSVPAVLIKFAAAAWKIVRRLMWFPFHCIVLLVRAYQIILTAGVCMGVFSLGGSAIAIGLIRLAQTLAPLFALCGIRIPTSPDVEDVAEKALGGIGMILSFGLIAFWFRSRHRLEYAIAEIMIGAILGLLAIDKYPFAEQIRGYTTSPFALFGGLYIVVRGLDNLDKSLINDTVTRRLFDEFLLLKRDAGRTGPIWRTRNKV